MAMKNITNQTITHSNNNNKKVNSKGERNHKYMNKNTLR